MAAVAEQPDIEAWVWANVKDVGPAKAITTWLAASELEHPPWQSRHVITVDCRASTKALARKYAYEALQRVYALADLHWPDGVITYVQAVAAPFWAPYDTGLPRYTAQYELRCHPVAGLVREATP